MITPNLEPGDALSGHVLKLPKRGTHDGNSIHLRTPTGTVIRQPATARKGHAVLARELLREGVQVGDEVTLTYHGWRGTIDGEREYRHWGVRIDHREDPWV